MHARSFWICAAMSLFAAESAHATDVAPTVVASIHDQPFDGVGDSFNSAPFEGMLRKISPTQEDRAIQEFSVAPFVGLLVTSATLQGTVSSNNAFDVGVRTFEFRMYAGNGSADLSDFSVASVVVGTGSYHPPVTTTFTYNFDATAAVQALLAGGATWIGLQVVCTSDPNYPNVLDVTTSKLAIVTSSTTGAAFCAGDGVLVPCPCGNTSAIGTQQGCLNSLGVGAALTGGGNPSLSNDTFHLQATGLPAGPGLYFQGTAPVASGAGAGFGDGLRCAGGTVIRLGIRTAAGGVSDYPAVGGVGIGTVGLIASGVGTRYYQLWYRDAVPYCTVATFGLTNGWSVTWSS